LLASAEGSLLYPGQESSETFQGWDPSGAFQREKSRVSRSAQSCSRS